MKLPVRKVKVWLGAHDVSLRDEEGRVVRGVTHAIVHEHFDSRDLSNDVALLRMDEPVVMSRTVRPICLPDVQDWDEAIAQGHSDEEGVVTGWGLTAERGRPSPLLLQVSLPFLSVESCKEHYAGINPVSANMLCTLHDFKDGVSRDSCKRALTISQSNFPTSKLPIPYLPTIRSRNDHLEAYIQHHV
ncbi:vitamin K-dependent protein C-like [Penaeus japonicus]|uniref:vitamin K-dependent protein C-like n=1 Tax=Penaeus japonicus TaxID=27405 RepID=UPI001C70CCFB|nr:vitamin K-dependent protein C-like [Penaeus japonicus]